MPEAKEEVEKVEGEEEKEEEKEVREQDECVDPDGHNEKRSKGAGGSSTGCSKQEKFQHRSRGSGENFETTEEKNMLVDCLLQEELQEQAAGKCRQTIPASEAG